MFLCRQRMAEKGRNIWCVRVREDVVANTVTQAHLAKCYHARLATVLGG